MEERPEFRDGHVITIHGRYGRIQHFGLPATRHR